MTSNNAITKTADELGFIRNNFEKIYRLSQVLDFINHDELLSNNLALKGGTAINLVIFDLPRLSVDIDLDFVLNTSKEETMERRQIIKDKLNQYMEQHGYSLKTDFRKHYALDSFSYSYVTSSGSNDSLKMDIHYLMRTHLFKSKQTRIEYDWLDRPFTVHHLDVMEIFSSKITALLSRSLPRDLFDMNNLAESTLFAEEKDLLRKCVVFYGAIGMDEVPLKFDIDAIWGIGMDKVRTHLSPLLKKRTFFDLNKAQKQVIDYLTNLLVLNDKERQFLTCFKNKQYKPELLFDDPLILERIINHPMAIWKCSDHQSYIDKEE